MNSDVLKGSGYFLISRPGLPCCQFANSAERWGAITSCKCMAHWERLWFGLPQSGTYLVDSYTGVMVPHAKCYPYVSLMVVMDWWIMKFCHQNHNNVSVNGSDENRLWATLESMTDMDNNVGVHLFVIAIPHQILWAMGNHRCTWKQFKVWTITNSQVVKLQKMIHKLQLYSWDEMSDFI